MCSFVSCQLTMIILILILSCRGCKKITNYAEIDEWSHILSFPSIGIVTSQNFVSLFFLLFWCWKGLSGWLSGQIVFLEAPSSEDLAKSIKAVKRDPHFFGSGSLSPSIHYLALVDGFQNRNIGNFVKTWRMCETHEICFVYVLLLFVGLFVCCVWSLFWLFVCFSIVCLFVCLFISTVGALSRPSNGDNHPIPSIPSHL